MINYFTLKKYKKSPFLSFLMSKHKKQSILNCSLDKFLNINWAENFCSRIFSLHCKIKENNCDRDILIRKSMLKMFHFYLQQKTVMDYKLFKHRPSIDEGINWLLMLFYGSIRCLLCAFIYSLAQLIKTLKIIDLHAWG